jgi:hypothetical protein
MHAEPRSTRFRYLIGLLLIGAVIFLSTAGPSTLAARAQASQLSLAAGTPMASGTGPSATPGFSDPFAFCGVAGTLDAPDERYHGPKLPDRVARDLQVALGLPDAPASNGAPPSTATLRAVWRCMDGKVYACNQGADTPCGQKADTGRNPNQAMVSFCQANPSNEVIPSSVTGLVTVYQWRCSQGKPSIIKQFVKPDHQGYLAHDWVEIGPQGQ